MSHDWIDYIKKSPVAARNKHLFDSSKVSSPQKKRKDCKQVVWVKEQLLWWCKEKNYELLIEHKFHEYRKFKFDFAIKELKISIEYEGINSQKSGHTTLTGYTKDTEKYNLAQQEGWRVIRFTVLNYETIIKEIEKHENRNP